MDTNKFRISKKMRAIIVIAFIIIYAVGTYVSLRGQYLEGEGKGKEGIVQNFKQITIDSKNKINDVNEANKYNVIVDLNSYGWPANCDFLNECFEKGKNILSSGNDVDDSIIIVDKAWYVNGNYNVE